MNWNDILKQYSSRALSAMCVALRVDDYAGKVNLSNRQRAIDQLRRVLGKPETVQRALAKMGPVETTMLKVLIRLGGRADTEQVKRTVEQETPMRLSAGQAQVTPDYQGIPSFDDAAARAMCYGLVFSRDNKEIDLKPGKYLLIPDPVLNVLRTDPAWRTAQARTGNQESQTVAVATPDVMLSLAAADFQRDLSRYLRHVRRQGDVALTTQGWIYKTNFKTFLAALNAPSDAPGDENSNARLWFMRRLLTAMGELHYADTGIGANPQGDLLTTSMAQRIKLSFETWCDTGAWNELNRITTEHQGYDYRRDAPPELSKARGVLLRLIARLVTNAITSQRPGSKPASGVAQPSSSQSDVWMDRWVATSQLIDLARRSEYQFLFSRKQRYRDFTGSTGYYNTPYYATNNPYNMTFPTVHDEQKGWDMVERQFVASVLTGPLYWMGLVSLGYRKGDTTGEGTEPTAFRLTHAGAWLLGLTGQPEFIESGGRVLVQPNFTIIAMEPVRDTVLIALDEFAESQGGDRAITYHITRQSVYRAQRVGWTAQRISAFLEQHQGGPIPANVQRSLEEWQALHQRIIFHRKAYVLQYADEAAREGAHEALKPTGLGLQSLSPTFELVESGQGQEVQPALERINAALSEAGWMPLVTPGSADMIHTESSLRINEKGEVAFKQAVPSLFALSQLQPYVERNGAGIRISAPSVRAAMSKGLSLDELLAIVAHLHDGPLLSKVETSIRAWAGFYGEAALQPVHLLELSSAEVLSNLLQDEQVGQYLKPIEGSTKPLAVVDAANVEHVRAILVERGVNVRAG